MRVLVAAGALLLLSSSHAFHAPADPGKHAAYENATAAEAVVARVTGSLTASRPGIAQPIFNTAIRSVILLPRLRESLAYPVFHEIINLHYDKYLPWSSSSFT